MFENESTKSCPRECGTRAINGEYAVLYLDGHISIQKVAYPDEEPQYLPFSGCITRVKPVLTLSPNQPSLLAVAAGSQIVIFDLDSGTLKCNIPGIGRAVTALCWQPGTTSVLAAGLIDGGICVWDLGTPNRPLRHLACHTGPCHAIAINPTDDRLLASVHSGTLSIWNFRRCGAQPMFTTSNKQEWFDVITWRPEQSTHLLAASPQGELRLYDISNHISSADGTQCSISSGEGDSDSGVFGKPDDVQSTLQLLVTVQLDAPLVHTQWVSEDFVITLAKQGRRAYLCELNLDGREFTKLWECEFSGTAESVYPEIDKHHGLIRTLGVDGMGTCELPVSVLNGLHPESLDSRGRVGDLSTTSADGISSTEAVTVGESKARTPATMKPVSISTQRNAAPGFSRMSKQLQHKRRSLHPSNKMRKVTAKNDTKPELDETLTPPPNRSMASSLELPKRNEGDFGSPMPFLSPTIPSRKPSPNDITPREDSEFKLPPVTQPSVESPIASVVATASDTNESDDSDDETFVDAMQGCNTFLPGGINVPLPKACGALFAPNGELLTFFPPRPRQASVRENLVSEADEPSGRKGHANKVARLFPTFGNLAGDLQMLHEDSDSEDSSSFEGTFDDLGLQPGFVFQPSSFPSQQSWKSRVSPTKPGFNVQPSDHKVVVNVCNIEDEPSLCPEQRELAETYQLVCEDGESGAEVCEHNATAADTASLYDTANIWRLMAMLLEDRVPLEILSSGSGTGDMLVIAQRAKALAGSDSGIGLADSAKHDNISSKLRWADDPLGGTWLMRQILEWAEIRGDTQLLACLYAILAQPPEHEETPNGTIQQSFVAKLPTHSLDYFTDSIPLIRQGVTRPIPVLRTSSVAKSPSMYESPTKLHRTSNTSSRNPSQPPTPYLNTTLSTPTFSLPSLSRQGTLLSTPGSASPEQHRSSFSAAAKYYAQSITDKFASYGTSPPMKRPGTSPSASNELSASLHSGSWSKSVSFAASSTTVDTTRGSLLSRSFDEQNLGDGYDSDKTVEDGSLPHTPKSPGGPIMPVSKNQHLFADDVSGAAKTKLLPEDLAMKGQAWCRYYAEQLRSWKLLAQAAELEKIAGITGRTRSPPALEADSTDDGVIPVTSDNQGSDNTCTICLTVVRRMEQVCPACHHVSHLSCLKAYTEDLDNGEFACPTSCGCLCSDLAFVVQELWQPSPQPRPTFRKKASFTDPRRWRARVEGDSW